MGTDAAESLARARALANAGWTLLLDADDVRGGRTRLAEARRVLAEALKEPAPQKVRFELVGVLAELSSQLGDAGTVARCASLLPVLAPKDDPALVESMLRRMVDRWGAHEAAERGANNLQHVLGPQRLAAVQAAVERRRRLMVDAPLTTRQILALRAHLSQLGIVALEGREVTRKDADGLGHTSAWLEEQGLPALACLDYLGLLGGTTDAEILLSVEPPEPYDVPSAWSAVSLARRVRAAERARGLRTPGPASGSVSVSAPVENAAATPVRAAARTPSAPVPAAAEVGGGGGSAAYHELADEFRAPATAPAGGPTTRPRPAPSVPAAAPAAPAEAGQGGASPTPAAPPDGLEIPFADPYGRFQGRFVDDGRAGYLYLLDRSGQRRLMTPLWVYNRVPAPDRMPSEVTNESAGPPMEAAVMVSPEPRPAPRPEQFELHMADDGAWVALQVEGRLVALLDYHQRVGWSRLLGRDTPYGLAWTPDLPESL